MSVKSDLRRSLLDRRLALTPEQRALASQAVARHFLESVKLKPEDIVAGYSPIKGEVDCLPLLSALIGRGHVCALPVTVGENMAFHRWTPQTAMTLGPFSVPEPQGTAEVIPTVVLTPLLAFDGGRHRLGYGKGFYDRTLAALRRTGNPRAIGLSYAFARQDVLPAEAHDQPLDLIVTEDGVIA